MIRTADPGEEEKDVLRVAVVDDEEAARELYGALARDWARRRSIEAEVAAFASAEQLLFSLDDAPCDVVLLDIEMSGLDGMGLARELRARGERTQIVFVTGIIDYALDGYDVDAASYLLKPVRAEKLEAALDRAFDRAGREEPVLVVESAGEISRVPLTRICFLEARGHDTLVTLADGTRLVSTRGIAQMEAELAKVSGLFLKTHRSYLVSLPHVRRITRRDVEMDTGDVLPIARGRWEELNRAWLAWCRGTLA